MLKIYGDAEDKYVSNRIVYAKSEDTFVYADSAYTVKINKADLKNLYLKGMVVLYGGAYYTPFKYHEESVYGAITIRISTTDSSFSSSEYTAG